MSDKLCEEYAVLDAQIKVLTGQKDNLRDEIIKEMFSNNEKNKDTAVGKFTIASLKTWTYTPKVTQLEEDFKALKAIEQSTGDATYEEKPSLRFTKLTI